MSRAGAKVIVVLPARDAARTLERTLSGVPSDWVDEIILVGDAAALTRRIPQLHLVWHPHDAGYGGNQKACFLQALEHGADVVVLLHPDGQYEPLLIPKLVEPIVEGRADMVLGSRLLTDSGMPRWKYTANRALTGIENALLGTRFSDLHTGYRAYSRKLLLDVPWLRNSADFAFDSELLFQAVQSGFRIHEVPARTIYAEDDSDMSVGEGVVYATKTLWAATRLALHRRGIWRSRRYLP